MLSVKGGGIKYHLGIFRMIQRKINPDLPGNRSKVEILTRPEKSASNFVRMFSGLKSQRAPKMNGLLEVNKSYVTNRNIHL